MIGSYLADWRNAWNQFWFKPREADTLAIMRILVGAMLIYTHAIWSIDLETFFGAGNSAIPTEYRSLFPHEFNLSWSHFDWFSSNAWMWGTHIFAMIVFTCFTIGLWTRATSILAFLFVVSYANRATGALFGLDQINGFLTLYLALGNCGSMFSVDSKLANGKGQGRGLQTVSNTIATRLIQIHLCIVYLFAGLGKLQGNNWWNGEAIWGTLASYEYQTLDMAWLSEHMWLVNLMTYAAISWEVSYAFLIWPKLTRPIFLTIAVIVHLGIGVSMGMMTFGLIMLIGNLAFVPPSCIRRRFGHSNAKLDSA